MKAALIVLVLLTGVYAAVFAMTDYHVGAVNILLWSISNAAPHVLLAVPLAGGFAVKVQSMAFRPAAALTAGIVVAYAATAYAGVIFLLALTQRIEVDGLFVRFFTGPALVWQMFQGLAYGLIAVLLGLWLLTRRQLAAARESAPQSEALPLQAPTRWLVRTAEGIVPIDPAELVRIEAAGEYCRLVLPRRTLMARISMNGCEDRLRGQPFLRAHRSHLVNSDQLVGAEPAGNGRLQLTLSNGDAVITSRQGAQLFRAVAV